MNGEGGHLVPPVRIVATVGRPAKAQAMCEQDMHFTAEPTGLLNLGQNPGLT
jgi:hypothetical protein